MIDVEIAAVAPADRDRLLQIAVRTGRFTEPEATALLGGVLDEANAETLPAGHRVHVARAADSGALLGWSYFAPDMYADAVWNLWWIGVDPPYHGHGVGLALLTAFERVARTAEGRMAVVETSALPGLNVARRFYRRAGYRECGCIPDFYGVGDDKVIFAKSLAES